MLCELGDNVVPEQGPGWVGSLILGIVEGLTEFLPVSSTGHLIVTNAFLGASDPAFEIACQVGAISAILFLYRERLWNAGRQLLGRCAEGDLSRPRANLWLLIVAAAFPAAVVGLTFKDQIEAHLFSPTTVAITLIVGGFLLIGLERLVEARAATGDPQPETGLDGMSIGQALWIGVFQCLALIPGTSRSGATIGGAMVLGCSRTAAAEFSFLVGLPVLYGACLIQMLDDWERLTGPLLTDFLIACVAAFVTAWAIVGPFVRFLQRHTFRPFAYYRIVAGGALLGLIAADVV